MAPAVRHHVYAARARLRRGELTGTRFVGSLLFLGLPLFDFNRNLSATIRIKEGTLDATNPNALIDAGQASIFQDCVLSNAKKLGHFVLSPKEIATRHPTYCRGGIE